ncbi:hypothetical protein RSSM_02599 [Rhodopirellula sallentina SM41]|uniref:Uncharacterized protein n=1 Tax=Rhodopirellula sallentina SM41 TaxID=1263870 RepID=M5U3C5_9BACT|nr:hypothetical protein RSSM_02599 [Rhodopirellula sallentina SM41]
MDEIVSQILWGLIGGLQKHVGVLVGTFGWRLIEAFGSGCSVVALGESRRA